MTDLRTLPSPFDRLAAVLDLAAAANNGHVAHETEIRARRTGDRVTLDTGLWMSNPSGDRLYAIDLATASTPVEVDAVEAAAARRHALDAHGAAIASASGFSRNARRRADELGVDLIDLHEGAHSALPSWLTTGGFESQELRWKLRNVSLPVVPGLPERFFADAHSRGDPLFANPSGRKFTADELVGRWLRAGNDAALMQSLPRDGRHVEAPVLLRFDRPMSLLANTVRPLPPLAAVECLLEAWLEVVRVPMTLVEDAPGFLDGLPRVAYASEAAPGDESGSRLWMWLAPGDDGGDPVLRLELLPGDDSPAPAE